MTLTVQALKSIAIKLLLEDEMKNIEQNITEELKVSAATG